MKGLVLLGMLAAADARLFARHSPPPPGTPSIGGSVGLKGAEAAMAMEGGVASVATMTSMAAVATAPASAPLAATSPTAVAPAVSSLSPAAAPMAGPASSSTPLGSRAARAAGFATEATAGLALRKSGQAYTAAQATSDSCSTSPQCASVMKACKSWTSQQCTTLAKSGQCATVLGPPTWPGNNCAAGVKWPYTYPMSSLQQAQFNCCRLTQQLKAQGNIRKYQALMANNTASSA